MKNVLALMIATAVWSAFAADCELPLTTGYLRLIDYGLKNNLVERTDLGRIIESESPVNPLAFKSLSGDAAALAKALSGEAENLDTADWTAIQRALRSRVAAIDKGNVTLVQEMERTQLRPKYFEWVRRYFIGSIGDYQFMKAKSGAAIFAGIRNFPKPTLFIIKDGREFEYDLDGDNSYSVSVSELEDGTIVVPVTLFGRSSVRGEMIFLIDPDSMEVVKTTEGAPYYHYHSPISNSLKYLRYHANAFRARIDRNFVHGSNLKPRAVPLLSPAGPTATSEPVNGVSKTASVHKSILTVKTFTADGPLSEEHHDLKQRLVDHKPEYPGDVTEFYPAERGRLAWITDEKGELYLLQVDLTGARLYYAEDLDTPKASTELEESYPQIFVQSDSENRPLIYVVGENMMQIYRIRSGRR